MRGIMAENDKVYLVIVGNEEPEKAGRISPDAFKKYGIENRTVWIRCCDDMPPLFSCFDVFTLPSWREGFPRSAIEAAAMGLPIVATNIRGCRQVVEDGVNGLLVPPKNSDALASAIKKLLADKQIRLKMGRAGYEKARREFDEKDVCKIVLEEYNRVLSKLCNKTVG
jgi:glycosyltransferase involved in cell wall biosynthesis